MCVFVQAEDGIRDLVRSRGLGDVYKRQRMAQENLPGFMTDTFGPQPATERMFQIMYPHLRQSSLLPRSAPSLGIDAVSYTHLTLPTSDLV